MLICATIKLIRKFTIPNRVVVSQPYRLNPHKNLKTTQVASKFSNAPPVFLLFDEMIHFSVHLEYLDCRCFAFQEFLTSRTPDHHGNEGSLSKSGLFHPLTQ